MLKAIEIHKAAEAKIGSSSMKRREMEPQINIVDTDWLLENIICVDPCSSVVPFLFRPPKILRWKTLE
jgi:hypothetical protein